MTRLPVTKSKRDETFSAHSAYGSNLWVARRLGKSYDWFFRNIDALRDEGFPKPDPLIGRYLKADVDKWIANRTQMSVNEVRMVSTTQPYIPKERLNAL